MEGRCPQRPNWNNGISAIKKCAKRDFHTNYDEVENDFVLLTK